MVVRCFHRLDHLIKALAQTDDSGRRKNDLVVAGLNVLRSEGASIVEFHPPVDLEGISLMVRRGGPALRQIADNLRIVMGVKFQK